MSEKNPSDSWIYLDNNATTRMDPGVLEAMMPFFRESFANPSSTHALGATAADAIREAHRSVQALLGASHEKEIVFTSGGSESNNTALLSGIESRFDRDEIITSTVEHPAILAVCEHLEETGRAKVHRIPVDQYGQLDLETYRRVLGERTAIVSLQWANNETGTIFPIKELAAMAHAVGALFHTDAVQAAGKVSIDVKSTEVDMLSLSAHKIHGPKGVGALYVRNGIRLSPLIRGGRQERGRRAGTENTAAIAGFGRAAQLALDTLTKDTNRIACLRDHMQQTLLRHAPQAVVVGDERNRLPNTLNIAFADIEADEILLRLDRTRIAASSGAACSTGSMEPSHVLRAMKLPFSYLRGAIRLSLSRETTEKEIRIASQVLPQIVHELRTMAMPTEAAYD